MACSNVFISGMLYGIYSIMEGGGDSVAIPKGLISHRRFGGLSGSAYKDSTHSSNPSTKHLANKPRGGLPRCYIESLPDLKGTIAEVKGEEFSHMSKVLRLAVDDRVELFDGKGGIAMGHIVGIGRSSMLVQTMEDLFVLPPSGPSWHVVAAFGSLKGGRADWLIEKCTELGAQMLTPLITERSTSELHEGRSERWQRVAIAAAKQCQRLHLPAIQNPANIKSLHQVVAASKLVLLAEAEATPLVRVLSGMPAVQTQGGILLVGPEGDFTREERDVLIEAGALPVGLGPRRLRVETAVIALLATTVLFLEAEAQ